jgi:hypothetical protein
MMKLIFSFHRIYRARHNKVRCRLNDSLLMWGRERNRRNIQEVGKWALD